jgi:hypothetical protein
MNVNERAKQALEDGRRWFPNVANSLGHDALSLCGEAGEVANLVKKVDRGTHTLPQVLSRLVDEVVDVQTYLYEIMELINEAHIEKHGTSIDWDDAYDIKRSFNENRFGKKGSFTSNATDLLKIDYKEI